VFFYFNPNTQFGENIILAANLEMSILVLSNASSQLQSKLGSMASVETDKSSVRKGRDSITLLYRRRHGCCRS